MTHRSRSWLAIAAFTTAVVSGCTHPSQPLPVRAPPASPKPEPPLRSASRKELLSALGALESPDVLGALPLELRNAIQQRLSQLPPEDRQALTAAEWARRRPLLHLAAGGNDPEALYYLVFGGAASELVELTAALGNTQLRGLAEPITQVTRAGAENYLFEKRLDVASPSGTTAELCNRIDLVAGVLGRFDLRLLARRTAAELEPSAHARVEVARALAWTLAPDEAQAIVNEIRDVGKEAPIDVALERDLAEVKALIASSRMVTREHTVGTIATAVDQASALLDLGRPSEAKRVLVSYQEQASGHLGLAAALALAELGGSACPGLPATDPHLVACSAAWRESEAVARMLPVLHAAWRSHQGRSERAVETYLGLHHIMPWLYTMARLDLDEEELTRQSKERVIELRGAIEAASGEYRGAPGLLLFVDLLQAGMEASDKPAAGGNVRIAEWRELELVKQARELAATSPEEVHTQAALLGVAAILAEDHDPSELLVLLPERISNRYRTTRWALSVWSAVAHQRGDLAERARAELMSLLEERDPSIERSELVLTMAEADAALTGAAERYAELLQVAVELGQQPLPADVALRVALDSAGVLDHQGKRSEAIAVLAQAVDGAVASHATGDLGHLARSYLLYLRGASSDQKARADYVQRLRSMGGELAGSGSAIQLAHALWLRELDLLIALDRCKATGCTRAQLERKLPSVQTQITSSVGAESALMARRGVLPLGTVTVSFSYSPRDGLQPRVELKPAFLAVPLP